MQYTAETNLKVNPFNHCIYGWGCFCLPKEHRFDPEFLLEYMNRNEQIDFEGLVCPKHIEKLRRKYEWRFQKRVAWKNYFRAEVWCRLKNSKNVIPIITDNRTSQKIIVIVNWILENKFSEKEKKGDFL